MAAKYQIKFWFEHGGFCLWSANDAARKKFGYPIQNKKLPISEALVSGLDTLEAEYATYLDWDYPPNPSPWTYEQKVHFLRMANWAFQRLCAELGDDFEVINEVESSLDLTRPAMDLHELQARIDALIYGEPRALDFRVLYFGDEIELYLKADDEKTCSKLTFRYCYKVSYENDAKFRWDGRWRARDMNSIGQLGYFASEINISESAEEEGFYEVKLVIPFLWATIICKEIDIALINTENEDFFWQKNPLSDSERTSES
ncbi:MAG: hypothetical protein FWE48_07905 [Coriobacteriia bacterium]|nr:hypothetical protein [Coriobacteriia bacterium]